MSTPAWGAENPGMDDAVEWHRFSKVTMLSGVIQLLGFLVVMAVIGLRQYLEDDSFDSLWHLVIDLGLIALWWGLAILAVLSIVVTILAAVSWHFKRFALAPDGIHLRTGVLMKKHTHVRWDRVQSVDITQNLMARVFRQGTVAIDSAGGKAEKIHLGLLTLPECHALRHAVMDVSAAVRAGQQFYVPDWQAHALMGHGGGVAAAESDEILVYRLTTGRMVTTALLSGAAFGGVLSLVGAIVMAILTTSAAAIPLILLVVGTVWSALKDLSKRWGTRVFLAPTGLRVRSGLVTTYAQTIAPGRIHAVQIVQPVLWRRLGWWKLKVLIASADSGESSEEKELASLVIPAGSRSEIDYMLWTLLPDLGVDDPAHFLDESFAGAGGSTAYTPAPRSSRIFDPFGWKRNGIALTRTVAVLRWGGFWRRSLTMVWHDHYQSLNLHQGLLQQRVGLVTLNFRMVGTQVAAAQRHLTLDDAHRILWAESLAGKVRRASAEKESLAAWRARVLV